VLRTVLDVPLAGDYYLCGPTAWMRDLSAGLLTSGVAPQRIHTEIFGSEPLVGAKRAPHPPPGEPGTGPEVAFTTPSTTRSWALTPALPSRNFSRATERRGCWVGRDDRGPARAQALSAEAISAVSSDPR
jgi:hypothetical protein